MAREFADVTGLAASIQQNTATASLILRKLIAYPWQNSLAVGLHELGRIERHAIHACVGAGTGVSAGACPSD
ncbi:Tn3 family transposase [Paraburkholderia sp. RL18-103-BIB-C]|uniref:Tn3 family transposase n=1 Tax=Paraburkholderia sp. RL18-103-BIB-C TaxID=3031637 RepID=UPI0038BA4944